MKKRTLLLTALLISVLITPCAAVRKKVDIRPVWQSGNAYIRLFKESGVSRGFDQPIQLREDEMRALLGSLFFSRYEYFHWTEPARVFPDDEVEGLARFFQQAFLDAGPDDEVDFYLPGPSRKLFGISGAIVLTRGIAFAKAGAIHFQFDNVREEMPPATYRPEDQNPVTQIAWKLVPQAGQKYDNETNLADKESPNLHWIRVDLSALAAKPAEAPTAASPGQATVPAAPATGTPGTVTVPSAPGATPAGPAAASPGTAAVSPGQATVPSPAPAPTVSAPALIPQPGPAVIPAPAPPSAVAPTPAQGSLERLKELKQMLDEGLITPKDYERKKKEILDSL